MIIIAHRGLWKKTNEKNSLNALRNAIIAGFGIETDIRDYNRKIIISHDLPDKDCISVEVLFRYYSSVKSNLTLALNVKSDGLQRELKRLLQKYKIDNYFVFDMSIPDHKMYLDLGLLTFTRQSEYELEPAFYNHASGIWLDQFENDWISKKIIQSHLNQGKKICIVSSELHHRDPWHGWEKLKTIEKSVVNNNIILCTDYPQKALEFFND